MRTEIRTVKLADLRLLEKNARFMANPTFRRLVENVRADGALTSVPFCYPDDDGTLEVLSGNHRVQAAIAAGIEEAEVMVGLDPLTRQQRIGIQLSHNSISGEDDPAVLRELYEELVDVDLRAYSGLDDKTLELLAKVEIGSLAEPSLDMLTITLAMLPDENERVHEVWKEAQALVTSSDETWLARRAEYDDFLDALSEAGASYRVTNSATSLMLLLRLWKRDRIALAEGWLDEEGEASHDGWVPLATVFGTDRIPAPAAKVVRDAVERLVTQGEVDPKVRWKALEYMAADHVAGAG